MNFVTFKLDYFCSRKYLTNYYRQLVDLKNIAACAFVNGSLTNPLISVLKKIGGKALEPVMKPCPYFGEVKVMNLTLDMNDFYYVFPEGTYKTKIKLHDDRDDNIFTFTAIAYLKSGMKN